MWYHSWVADFDHTYTFSHEGDNWSVAGSVSWNENDWSQQIWGYLCWYDDDWKEEEQNGNNSQGCPKGTYLKNKNNDHWGQNEHHTECLKCPEGCKDCTAPDQCEVCDNAFDTVTGPGFTYCFPKCLSGNYRQTDF